MSNFLKKTFDELTPGQKINAMKSMLNHFCKSNDYLSNVDKEWTFEILNAARYPKAKYSDKVVCFNRKKMEELEKLIG